MQSRFSASYLHVAFSRLPTISSSVPVHPQSHTIAPSTTPSHTAPPPHPPYKFNPWTLRKALALYQRQVEAAELEEVEALITQGLDILEEDEFENIEKPPMDLTEWMTRLPAQRAPTSNFRERHLCDIASSLIGQSGVPVPPHPLVEPRKITQAFDWDTPISKLHELYDDLVSRLFHEHTIARFVGFSEKKCHVSL